MAKASASPRRGKKPSLKGFLFGLWTFLTAGGIFLGAALLLLLSSGFLKEVTPDADASSVLRIFVGVFGGLLLAASVWMNLLVDTLNSRADSLDSAFETIRAKMAHSGDRVLRGRDELVPWTDALRNRQTIRMVGMSLRAFSRDHLDTVRAMLRGGGRCVFVLLKPGSTASAQAARTYNRSMSIADYDREIETSTERLRALMKEFPKQVTIKQIAHIPIASITHLEGGDAGSRIIAELYTMDESSHRRPHLDLSPEANEQWFNYFRSEMDKLEREAAAVTGAAAAPGAAAVTGIVKGHFETAGPADRRGGMSRRVL